MGGYLLNDVKYTEDIFIEKIGYDKSTTLKDQNMIIDLINGLNRTPYKINTDTLNFIYLKVKVKKRQISAYISMLLIFYYFFFILTKLNLTDKSTQSRTEKLKVEASYFTIKLYSF